MLAGMLPVLRILLVADSHLGLDLPLRPRIARRRRGHDFLANHAAALELALRGEVDLVVHGGDVFHRPRVPASLAHQAYAPLLRVADQGVPVFVVPGNHERSRLPHAGLARHPNLHVFNRARTFTVDVRGARVALAGFPFERAVRARFPELLERTGWQREPAALRLLCVHQCVEGATVGPGDFTFTAASDVIRACDVPRGLAAVLSGHIHRQQVLTTDLRGRPLAAPVLYPGSIERTSAAEIGEPKGFLVVDVAPGDDAAAIRWEFRRLPARPMLRQTLRAPRWSRATLDAAVRALVAAAPADAVLQIRVEGDIAATDLSVLSAARLRAFVPETQNLEIRVSDAVLPFRGARGHERRVQRRRAAESNLQLEL
jgi:DNA repair exonuclease SbcCD nuclease subunit